MNKDTPTNPDAPGEALLRLKQNWLSDPCWDIECTEGFEAHEDELLAFRKKHEEIWEKRYNERMLKNAEIMGCPGNIKLAAYITMLEERIDKIMEPCS